MSLKETKFQSSGESRCRTPRDLRLSLNNTPITLREASSFLAKHFPGRRI